MADLASAAGGNKDKSSEIAVVFDQYKGDYSKKTGSKGGVGVSDDKKFSSKIQAQIKNNQKGGFLKQGISGLPTLSKDGLLAAIVGEIGDLQDMTFGSLLKDLKSLEPKTGNLFRDLGLGGLITALDGLNNLTGGLLGKLLGALLSQVYIPDIVYLAQLMAFDAAGADLEYNNNYIRKLILTRDLKVCLKWWNETWGIKYSGLAQDLYSSDANVASKNGAYENLGYILDQYYSSYNELTLKATNTKDPDEQKLYTQSANHVYEAIVRNIKYIIIYGWGNFKASDLNDLISKYKISPSFYGQSDTKYSGRYNIDISDINVIAPFYRPAKGGLINTVAQIFEDRSSKYRRDHAKTDKNPFDFTKTFINPRNINIKRLYFGLTDKNAHGDKVLYNPQLAERLTHPIMTTIGEVIDESLKNLIPSAFFDTKLKLWNSAYDYTIAIESWLKNPPKMQFISLVDTDVVTMPSAVPVAGNANKGTNTKNGMTEKTTKTTGSKLAGKDLKDRTDQNGLQTDFEDYIKMLVDRFLNLDLEKHIQNILDRILAGTLLVTSADMIENLILEDFKRLGGDILEYKSMNARQIYSKIIDNIRDGTYTKSFLTLNTIGAIQTQVMNELITAGTYVGVSNNSADINILKLMMLEMQDKIADIIGGATRHEDVITIEQLIRDCTLANSNGQIGTIGSMTYTTQVVLINFNNILYNINSDTPISAADLLGGKSLQDLISEANAMITSGQKIIDKYEQVMLLVYDKLVSIYPFLMDGTLSFANLQTLKELMIEAQDLINAKTDLTSVYNLLKNSGVDVSGVDPKMLDLKDAIDFLQNTDPSFFEFDIHNPPKKVVDSIYKEYANSGNWVNIQYHWVGDQRVPFVFPNIDPVTGQPILDPIIFE